MAFDLTGTIQEELIIGILIEETEKKLVASNFVRINTGLSGLSSYKIPGITAPTTGAYTGADFVPTAAADTSVIVTLDKSRYFANTVDKVDNEQAAVGVIENVLRLGVEQLAKDIDIATFLTLSATTNANAVTGTALDATNVVGWILGFGTKLDELDAPLDGRKLAITPAIAALLAEKNLAFQTTTAEEAARTGFVGRFGGFDIFKTNNLPAAVTGKYAIATAPNGAELGIGFQEASVIEMENNFKWLAKGLVNYGSKISQAAFVVKSDAELA